MNDAHDDGRRAWPLDPLARRAKISPPCVQIQRRPVDRVSPWAIVFVAIRPNAPPSRSEIEGATEEVGDEIGVAVAALVQRLQPVRDTPSRVASRERVLARERRVAHERIEPRVRPLEHLRELELPVERHERPVGVAPLLEPAAVLLGLASLRPRRRRPRACVSRSFGFSPEKKAATTRSPKSLTWSSSSSACAQQLTQLRLGAPRRPRS